MAPEKKSLSFASVLLCACMFASGGCGIILEYIQAALASMILGNAFEQWAMVIGLMLFWMGFGSLIQTRISKPFLIYAFVGIEIGLALAGGFSPTLTYLAYGYTAHYVLVLYFFVSFIGIMIGLEIPVIIRINNDFSKELSTNLGNILSADYIGSLAGALIYVFVLLRFVPITEAAFLTAGMNFLLAFATYVYFVKKKLIRRGVFLPVLLCLCAGAVVFGYTENRQWQLKIEQPLYEDPIVLSKTSQYQHIAITHYRPFDEVRLFLNGNLQFCSTDEDRYHESMVHPVMNLVARPEKVLILGGGDGCALREVLKYETVRKVLLVDLDPEMTYLASTHPLLRKINQDAFQDARVETFSGKGVSDGGLRSLYMDLPDQKKKNGNPTTRKIADVRIMNVDADLFLKTVKGSWDVIIVDMPDPSTPELVKLYSKQFYSNVRRKLSLHGMMVVQSTSPYLAKQSFLCIGRTITAAGLSILPFHENVPSFGDWGWFLAWHPQISTEKIRQRIAALEIPAETRYLTADVFRAQTVFGKNDLQTDDTRVNTLSFPALLSIYNHESWLLD